MSLRKFLQIKVAKLQRQKMIIVSVYKRLNDVNLAYKTFLEMVLYYIDVVCPLISKKIFLNEKKGNHHKLKNYRQLTVPTVFLRSLKDVSVIEWFPILTNIIY